mmetsp:Transcript_19386/g.27260  ORF Transcript_19386/g.27260 Transcript_19386/m.27260 type:complete len:230 (+) Transcript_19386:1012-1701(+)
MSIPIHGTLEIQSSLRPTGRSNRGHWSTIDIRTGNANDPQNIPFRRRILHERDAGRTEAQGDHQRIQGHLHTHHHRQTRSGRSQDRCTNSQGHHRKDHAGGGIDPHQGGLRSHQMLRLHRIGHAGHRSAEIEYRCIHRPYLHSPWCQGTDSSRHTPVPQGSSREGETWDQIQITNLRPRSKFFHHHEQQHACPDILCHAGPQGCPSPCHCSGYTHRQSGSHQRRNGWRQ